jgi:chromosome segregation protein
MRLKTLELNGFKSFANKTVLSFDTPVVSVVGPNGSGKSNVVEAIRFVLGEQSMKSMRGRAGTDMIFKGSKNLPKGSRATVSIYLDNTDKIFKLLNDSGESIDLNYDTVSISREVYPDGMNKYILNGSEVRLRDINNLLSSVNIGASGHHIISQGEADRILNANAKDRREMIEDALGLKIYQYKIKESERKLERTQNNMKEVVMLRRENAPHLNFLRKQVEKFEKLKELQAELLALYKEYLKKESFYIEKEKAVLLSQKSAISVEFNEVSAKISENDRNENTQGNKKIEELRLVEQKINECRNTKGELERKLGRIEGMIEAKENRVRVSGRCPTCGKELGEVDSLQIEKRQNEEKEVQELKASQSSTLALIQNLETKIKELSLEVDTLKALINSEMEELRDKEREKFSFKVKQQELSSALGMINVKLDSLRREEENLENEIKEGNALVGHEILYYKDFVFEGEIDKALQEENKRKIDRIKIKLEDAGGTNGAEIKKEYDDVVTRDNFLAKELEDLEKSINSLQLLVADLKEKIDTSFKEGIKKINTEFDAFFKLMFGGGTGNLSVVVENKKKKKDEDTEMAVEEEIEFQEGIEINVSLPHKKVKELHALSGGERSLTSIALLFAMSQVNPPPFLVLDETDAALDEANSRKYGDMIEKLSKHSQLIVVTHNRETMSRAGVLYGVTIGADGGSKLLSVKFDEAVAIAK